MFCGLNTNLKPWNYIADYSIEHTVYTLALL